MISERWVLPPPVWTFLSVQSHSWGKCWRKRVQAAGVFMYGPDLRVQLSKRSKLIAPVSISTCPLSHTRCRQTCWLLRIFRPGDTLKSLLPLWILSIKPRHHPMTKHAQVGPLKSVSMLVNTCIIPARWKDRCGATDGDIVNEHLTHRSTYQFAGVGVSLLNAAFRI